MSRRPCKSPVRRIEPSLNINSLFFNWQMIRHVSKSTLLTVLYSFMQSEYKRGVSAWNFDIEDLKAQAALVSNIVFC